MRPASDTVGIDPKGLAALHDVADAAAHAAETMAAAKQKFTDHYELPREFAGERRPDDPRRPLGDRRRRLSRNNTAASAPGASPPGAGAYPLNGGGAMMQTRYPRPCPIPGHPQDEDEPALVTESAWARLRAWHLHAPTERLPLPVILTRLAGRLGPARGTRAGPRRHLRHRRRRGGMLGDVAPLRAQPPSTRGCCRPRPPSSPQRPAAGSPPLPPGGRSAGPRTC